MRRRSDFIAHARLDGVPELWVVLVLWRHTTSIIHWLSGCVCRVFFIYRSSNSGEQSLVLFLVDTVALADYIVQLGLVIICLKGVIVRVDITIKNGDVCEISHAQLCQCTALLPHIQDDRVVIIHRIYYKHFNSRADI